MGSGWFDQNGAWFDGGAFAFNDSDNKTLAVKNRAKTDLTLSWAPGNLVEKSILAETLANNTTSVFETYVNTAGRVEARIAVNGAGDASLKYYNLSTGDLIADPWDDAGRAGGGGGG